MTALDNLQRELARIEEPDYGRLHDLVKRRSDASRAVMEQRRVLEAAERRLDQADSEVNAARVEAAHLRVAIKALESATEEQEGGQS